MAVQYASPCSAVKWTGAECYGIYSVSGQELQPQAGITARWLAVGVANGNFLQVLAINEAGALLEARCVRTIWCAFGV